MDTNLTILIVEDDIIAHFFIKSLLENLGIKADFSDTGKKAVDMANHKKYAIVFMDLGLPDISGIEATKAIRANQGKNKETPIVALTAHDTEAYRLQAKEAGMNDFKTKPITEDLIKAVLHHFKLL